ncbi:hypothetical protein CEP52_015289 [Fusarium oligoseptatum]|uniref:Uncharacterized protein n=1 Tax=Fusarium oligoseptatum TaxID=2604345 RepID=A0A428SEM0_9HYPO|nr:hypothetical protein CEP52_015289 [Fusarium oligoseptatum]
MGSVILGGYWQKGISDASTYVSYETESILNHTKKLSSGVPGDPEILSVVASMRTSREGGAPVERD